MSQVKLILTESVHSLGEAGDLVRVKPGYARNYLLPQGKAVLATESRVAELEHHKRIAADKAARELKDLELVKRKLDAVELEVSARAGEEGKLFGSVTVAQIAELLKGQGFEIDRRRIDLRDPIKEVGEHKVAVKLHRELSAEISVRVAAEGAPPTDDEDLEGDSASDRDRSARDRDDEDDREAAADEG